LFSAIEDESTPFVPLDPMATNLPVCSVSLITENVSIKNNEEVWPIHLFTCGQDKLIHKYNLSLKRHIKTQKLTLTTGTQTIYNGHIDYVRQIAINKQLRYGKKKKERKKIAKDKILFVLL
jgi:hypothetical protein